MSATSGRPAKKSAWKAGCIHSPKKRRKRNSWTWSRTLNADPKVHGILVQLPLPKQIEETAIIQAVSPNKDVDGFGTHNLGLLTMGQPRFQACTPLGVQQLLVRNNIPIEGRHVVILGRSNIVGKPLALILMQKAKDANATVTVCHSRSRDIPSLTRLGDIVVAAIGQARFS